MTEPDFREIWLEAFDGGRLCALINGGRGWLMFLREPGDAGFSSRNPGYDGPADALIEYRLSNGQLDQYPASWAYPIDVVERALDHVRTAGTLPPFIVWHDDGAPERPAPCLVG